MPEINYDSTITPILFVSLAALVVSLVSLGLSVYFWSRSFRPIVTAMVKTHLAGNEAIAYNLQLMNTGSLPAKNIRLTAESTNIDAALSNYATDKNREIWLSCFSAKHTIAILQNSERVSCSFGTTARNDHGFWKYHAEIPIVIHYQGWFGKKYKQKQRIQIIDSGSFTGVVWGKAGAS